HEIVKIDDIYTFTFGTVTVNVQVQPWHSEDVLVKVYAYVGTEGSVNAELAAKLLEINTRIPIGAFGVAFDGQPVFSYTLTGENLDLNEFTAAVQMVAMTADEYDEMVKQETVLA
ncbi:MAG: YbjN domain-containing protein, partial [Microscillaceae bacterium]|nr:YbjN domain-containing protein [Microscillaceae bacterium]MDW8459704.1 YbjN domain-containing protein [Cytophagales bacterium]